jgi:hypothetical protein
MIEVGNATMEKWADNLTPSLPQQKKINKKTMKV